MTRYARCPQPTRVRGIRGPIGSTIYIGTPTWDGSVCLEFAQSMQRLQRVCGRMGIRVQWITVVHVPVEQARDRLAALFLKTSGDVLVFIDADQGFPVRAVFDVVRLAYTLDVVVAAVPVKSIDWQAVWAAARKVPQASADVLLPMLSSERRAIGLLRDGEAVFPDEPFEIAAAGTGFMAIRRRVFERIAAAAPADTVYKILPDFAGPTWFSPLIRDGKMLSEDVSFCCRWNAVGGRLWATCWHIIEHVGPMVFADDIALRTIIGQPMGTLGRRKSLVRGEEAE